jgi:hypothetical protein
MAKQEEFSVEAERRKTDWYKRLCKSVKVILELLG